MRNSRSEPQLFQTRRNVVRDHIGGAVPGYAGHVPGQRIEVSVLGGTFTKGVEASRHTRSRPTIDCQAHRLAREDRENRANSAAPPARAPCHDSRGIGYAAAGDTRHSRVAVAGEEKAHLHSTMGLTSLAHEGLGGAGQLKGYSKAAVGIPGYAGYVPGKAAENVFADTWSKSHERSLGAHFDARRTAPKKWSVVAEGNTLVSAAPRDSLKEIPIKNPSYQDRVRGWSTCDFTGSQVDPAGRLAPRDRQEGFNGVAANLNPTVPIHGYAGWVPGRVGENVVGERQCKTNAVSAHLFNKSRMRITQR